jgi:hypothetical protein
MRILNRAQLARVPMVDAGNLYLGEVSASAEVQRARIARANAQRAAQMRVANARAAAAAAAENNRRMRAAQMHGEMLERSLRQSGANIVAAAKRQGSGWVPQYGVKNPLLGFVDETVNPDYSQSEVYNAQEFNNRLTANDNRCYVKFKDYPLVLDSPKGDFGGILTSEGGSPDFSHMIVDDVQQDFGYTPRPRRRR